MPLSAETPAPVSAATWRAEAIHEAAWVVEGTWQLGFERRGGGGNAKGRMRRAACGMQRKESGDRIGLRICFGLSDFCLPGRSGRAHISGSAPRFTARTTAKAPAESRLKGVPIIMRIDQK